MTTGSQTVINPPKPARGSGPGDRDTIRRLAPAALAAGASDPPDARSWTVLLLATVVLTLTVGGGIAPHPSHAEAGSGSLELPIPAGQTWYVCQGYNGEVTHSGMPGLDLSLEPSSAGSKGCMAGSKYSSAGSVVSSPGAGSVYHWPGCCGDDFVCVNLDSGGSIAVGHLSDRIPNGSRVEAGMTIGSVAWPHHSNGDYAHIHVQAHPEANCTEGSDPVAFDVAHGFRWACTPDLPYSGVPNQYAGLAVKGCKSVDAIRPTPGGAEQAGQTNSGWEGVRALIRSIVDLLSSWM